MDTNKIINEFNTLSEFTLDLERVNSLTDNNKPQKIGYSEDSISGFSVSRKIVRDAIHSYQTVYNKIWTIKSFESAREDRYDTLLKHYNNIIMLKHNGILINIRKEKIVNFLKD